MVKITALKPGPPKAKKTSPLKAKKTVPLKAKTAAAKKITAAKFLALNTTNDEKFRQKALQKRQSLQKTGVTKKRGVIVLSNIPHGFFEGQMKAYFRQFGGLENIRLVRSKRTGQSCGYAYVEFQHYEVAKIVAKHMDGYLTFGRIMKCRVVPPEVVTDKMFKGKDIRPDDCPKLNIRKGAIRKLNKRRTEEQQEARVARLQLKYTEKLKKLQELGVDLPLNTLLGTQEQKEGGVEGQTTNGHGAPDNTYSDVDDSNQASVTLPEDASDVELTEDVDPELTEDQKEELEAQRGKLAAKIMTHLESAKKVKTPKKSGAKRKSSTFVEEERMVLDVDESDDEVVLKTPPNAVKRYIKMGSESTPTAAKKDKNKTPKKMKMTPKGTPKESKSPKAAMATPKAMKTPKGTKETPKITKLTPKPAKATPGMVKVTPKVAKTTPGKKKTTPKTTVTAPEPEEIAPQVAQVTPKVAPPEPDAPIAKKTPKATLTQGKMTPKVAKATPGKKVTPKTEESAPQVGAVTLKATATLESDTPKAKKKTPKATLKVAKTTPGMKKTPKVAKMTPSKAVTLTTEEAAPQVAAPEPRTPKAKKTPKAEKKTPKKVTPEVEESAPQVAAVTPEVAASEPHTPKAKKKTPKAEKKTPKKVTPEVEESAPQVAAVTPEVAASEPHTPKAKKKTPKAEKKAQKMTFNITDTSPVETSSTTVTEAKPKMEESSVGDTDEQNTPKAANKTPRSKKQTSVIENLSMETLPDAPVSKKKTPKAKETEVTIETMVPSGEEATPKSKKLSPLAKKLTPKAKKMTPKVKKMTPKATSQLDIEGEATPSKPVNLTPQTTSGKKKEKPSQAPVQIPIITPGKRKQSEDVVSLFEITPCKSIKATPGKTPKNKTPKGMSGKKMDVKTPKMTPGKRKSPDGKGSTKKQKVLMS